MLWKYVDKKRTVVVDVLKNTYLPRIKPDNVAGAVCGAAEANKCSADAMSRCTDPLKVVTDNKDLGFATSKEELDEMCP